MKHKIVVQIPCLNEEKTIGIVVKDIKKKLPSAKVIVYDNDSSDNSINVAKKSGAEIVIEKERGKGNVVRRMFSDVIDANYFIMIDADNTYDVSQVSEALKKMINEKIDMLVAKRIHTDSEAYRRGHLAGNFFLRNLLIFVLVIKFQIFFQVLEFFQKDL